MASDHGSTATAGKIHSLQSTCICASAAFAVLSAITLAVLAFGSVRPPGGKLAFLVWMLGFAAAHSACVAAGHGLGLLVGHLRTRSSRVAYAMRLPIRAAVLSVAGTLGLGSMIPALRATGSFLLLLVVCGCGVTATLQLVLPRWMVAGSPR